MKSAFLAASAIALAIVASLPASAAIQQCGIASWYGPGFHGRTTASGERFNQNALTAAHPTLPFGTIVDVERLDGEGSVRVRINDRGPFVGNRIIDLSRAAAAALEMIGPGVVPVRVTSPAGNISLGDGC